MTIVGVHASQHLTVVIVTVQIRFRDQTLRQGTLTIDRLKKTTENKTII